MGAGTITEGYKALLQETHAQSPGWGAGAARRVEELVPLIRSLGYGFSVLDYGCGKGTLKTALLERFPQLQIAEYDPGILGKDGVPSPADLVVCTDVLEHVEFPQATLAELRRLTKKMLFLIVGLGPAKKFLPDGRNAHLHQWQPAEWHRTVEESGLTILESYGTLKHWVFHARA